MNEPVSLANDPAPWKRLLESLWIALLGGACAFCVFQREPVGTFGCAVAFCYAVIASEKRRQAAFVRWQAERNAERRRPRGHVISHEEARRLNTITNDADDADATNETREDLMKTPAVALLERYEITALQQHFDAKAEQDDVPLETYFVLRLCKQAAALVQQADSDALLIRQLFEALMKPGDNPRLALRMFDEVVQRLDGSWRSYDCQEKGVLRASLERREAAKQDLRASLEKDNSDESDAAPATT